MKVPSGMSGTVIDVQVSPEKVLSETKRAQEIIDSELSRYRKDLDDQLRIVEQNIFDRVNKLLVNSIVTGGPGLTEQRTLDQSHLSSLGKHQWFEQI